jgi:hypothetical protein
MIDPPVSPSERLSDALFQLANAVGRLSDAFELLHCTLIATATAGVEGAPRESLGPGSS